MLFKSGTGLPPVLAGRAVLGLAQDGTGKTAAFALPILQRLLLTKERCAPRALLFSAALSVEIRSLAKQFQKDPVRVEIGDSRPVETVSHYVRPVSQDARYEALRSVLRGIDQGQGEKAMPSFRSGKTSIMVATDIAARGIDVAQISHAINFDIPDTPEAYTHRIGRTDRTLRKGVALTFVTPEDRQVLRSIERFMGASIPLMDGRAF